MFGEDIAEVLEEKGHDVIRFKGRSHVDLCDAAVAIPAIREARPQAIVHAAAWRDIDRCETEPVSAFENNALGTRNVMLAATGMDCKVVHISTDAVFDGEKGTPYHEFDSPNPINVYGLTKLAAENEVRSFVRRHFIVRVPLLLGLGGPPGANLIVKTVEKARKGEEIVAACDQVASPTYTRHAAQIVERLLGTDLYGTYHVCNAGSGSRWDVAVEILRLAGYPTARVRPVASAELRRPGPRQRYVVMTSICLKAVAEQCLPDWRAALSECMKVMAERRPELFS
jgi:dTDP-4-dehydrorhamnose reductase